MGGPNTGSESGKKMGWSQLYQGDRPEDVLPLERANAAKLAQAIGFAGHDQEGNESEQFILTYTSSDAITLTDFAKVPIGTIIIAPKITKPTIFIKKLASSPAAASDWFKLEGAECS